MQIKGAQGKVSEMRRRKGGLEGLAGAKRRVCACVKGRFGIPEKSAPN